MASTPTHASPLNHISCAEVHSGDPDSAGVIIQFNRKRIAVTVNLPDAIAATQPQTAEQSIISLALRMEEDPFDEDGEALQDKIVDMVLDIGEHAFEQVAPPVESPSPSRPADLHSLLYPETYHFLLTTRTGVQGPKAASLVPIAPEASYFDPEAWSGPRGTRHADARLSNLQRYSTRDVQVLRPLVGSAAVCLVQAGGPRGCKALCKAHSDGLEDGSLRRELAVMETVAAATLSSQERQQRRHGGVPRLLGYVTHPEKGPSCIVGLLREWIPGRRLSDELKMVGAEGISGETREKLAGQIRETMAQLHGLGLFWGDVKCGNVVLDESDDAWVIDFGGGWTQGWVDEALAGTCGGDEQGYKAILRALKLH